MHVSCADFVHEAMGELIQVLYLHFRNGKHRTCVNAVHKILGIVLDDAITFKCRISELCRKLKFAPS